MDLVVTNAATLADAYDIIRVDSNVDFSSPKDDICFMSLANELTANFNIEFNTFSIPSKRHGYKPLILPNLKLKIVLEAVRVSLEIVYRPHFSKLSHGCRRERGHLSALNFISRSLSNKIDWFVTLPMDSPADINVVSKLISIMEEKIEDRHLFSFIVDLFHAGALNLSFGCFPKFQGLPQEGVLSSILINIYLNELDQELIRIFMKYECFQQDGQSELRGGSKLRDWVRRKISGANETSSKFHACRVLDEVLITSQGTLETACKLGDEVVEFLRTSLFINSHHQAKVLPVNCPNGIQFLGLALKIPEEEKPRAVHKLRDKVRAFSSMKKEAWETLMLQLGKKWLAHGLKKLKESEIQQLQRSTPTLDSISRYRKEGMKTDHWFKVLLKVWLQDAGDATSEVAVLSKLVAEPAMPDDLQQAFHDFMNQAEDYLQVEEKSTIELLSQEGSERKKTVAVEVPARFIRRRLDRYGLIDLKGNPRCVRDLVLQDDGLILLWFAGLVRRWRRWFASGTYLPEVEVRRSCVRTLAVKHRMAEEEIVRRFGEELDKIFVAGEFAGEFAGGVAGPREEECYAGLCLLSLEETMAAEESTVRCSVMGCTVRSTEIYELRRKESQSFPGWKTGFSPAIFSGLHGRRIAMCKKHVGDLYTGVISLNSVDFGSMV